MPSITLTLNGKEQTNQYAIESLAELKSYYPEISRLESAEVWLNYKDGKAISLLKNGNRAWLMYLRYEGDAGFSSRNPAYQGPADAELEFYLLGGQADSFPVAWTIEIAQAFAALEVFLINGERSPAICWHKD